MPAAAAEAATYAFFFARTRVRRGDDGAAELKRKQHITHSKQPSLHFPPPLRITIDPPLRPPIRGILSKDIWVPMHHPRTHSHHSPAFKVLSTYGRALRRNNALERQSKRWMQAPGFLDAGVEVGERVPLLECDSRAGRGGRGRRQG